MSASRRALKKVRGVLGKYVNREVLAERVQGTRKAFSEISRGTVLEVTALSLIVIIAVAVRLMPIRWGFYLNEFDPYLQWRMSQYVVDNGFLAWFSWRDTMSWYPYGAYMPTWNLYGEAFVVAAVTMLLRVFGAGVSVFEVAVVFPVVAGTITILAAYALGKDIWGRGAGMFAALFLALNASSIARTQLGFLRHEPLGILLMILIFLFFRRASLPTSSTRKTMLYATLAGVSLYYLAATWAAFYFPLDLLVLYSVVLAILGRSSRKLLLTYSMSMGIFLLLTPFLVPKLGFGSLMQLTWLAVPAGMVVLLIRETATYIQSRRMQAYTWTAAVAATFAVIVTLLYFGVIGNPAGKFLAVINPFIRGSIPIIQSVAEHQPATWASFYYEFGTLIFLMLFGFVFILQKARNDDIFILLWGLTSIYFAASFVRLTLLVAPAFSILAAIGAVELGKPAVDIIREAVIYPKRKTRVIARVGREFGFAIFLILLIIIVPAFWNSVQTAYQPATIVTSSIPTRPQAGNELKYQDWLEALSWMRENTPSGSVVFAWWDYGYWITALGDRRSLADNGTQNSTQIGVIAQTFLANTTMAIPSLKRYDVSYVAIFITPSGGEQSRFQGFGEDGKWYWMARIGNNTVWNNYKVVFTEERTSTGESVTSTYYRVIQNLTSGEQISSETIAENNMLNDKSILGYMMSAATQTAGTVGTGAQSPYFAEVFSSSNRYVYLFQVKYPVETHLKMLPVKNVVTYGDKVVFSGELTDSNGRPLFGQVVHMEYSADNGQTWSRIWTVEVSPKGTFNYTWAPNAGQYSIRAAYEGREGFYVDARSDPQPLQVMKANVTLTLSASTPTVVFGRNVTLSVQMQPFINNTEVTIAYSDDNRTFTPIRKLTMTGPTANFEWRVNVSGRFTIRVEVNNDNFNVLSSPLIVIESRT